jgi:hypothetical protein
MKETASNAPKPSEPPRNGDEAGTFSILVIAGMAGASLALLVIIIVGCSCVCRRCRSKTRRERNGSQEPPTAGSMTLVDMNLLDWDNVVVGKGREESPRKHNVS